MKVEPATAKSTLKKQNATVTMVDQNGIPMSGFIVNSKANSDGAEVFPATKLMLMVKPDSFLSLSVVELGDSIEFEATESEVFVTITQEG